MRKLKESYLRRKNRKVDLPSKSKRIMKLLKNAFVFVLVMAMILNPFGSKVMASETYTLYNDVKVYSNAMDAKNKVNSSTVYPAGEYFIYKVFDQMLNISKKDGVPGGWINPSDNMRVLKKSSFVTMGTSVNVRSNPQTGNNIIATKKLGDIFEGELLANGWIRLQVNGRVGYTSAYLYGDIVDFQNRYVKSSVNIRSNGSTTSKVIGSLKAGTQINGVKSGNWFKFIYKGQVGYVYMALTYRIPSTKPLTLDNPINREIRVSVNVREDRDFKSQIAFLAKPGQIYQGQKEGDWFKFIHEGNYVYAYYPFTMPIEEHRLTHIEGSENWTVTSTLNVRNESHTNATIMGSVSPGLKISGVLENNWVKFIYNDEHAYVYSQHLDREIEEEEKLTPLTDKSVATEEQMVKYLLSVNPTISDKYLKLAKTYLVEGEIEGIRGDLAFAQSLLETGNFTFGGDVAESQNNYAGIGATGGGNPGNSFPTPEIGVRAQIQHLKAYANTEPLVQENVDPRFHYVVRASAPYLEWLSIQLNPYGYGWAYNANYAELILGILDKILEQ